MIGLRHYRLTYNTAHTRQVSEDFSTKEKADIEQCLSCPYSRCVFGYCNLVGSTSERRNFKKSEYYKKISKVQSTALKE